MSITENKTQPDNYDAQLEVTRLDEQLLIGNCLLPTKDVEIVPHVTYSLKKWHFTNPKNAVIFEAIRAIEDRDEDVDLNTVFREVTFSQSQIPITFSDLIALMTGVPRYEAKDKAVHQAIGRLKDAGELRFLRKLAGQIEARVNAGESSSKDIRTWIDDSLERLAIENATNLNDDFVMVGDMADDMAQMYKDFHEGKITSVYMPFPSLNELLGFGGLMPNDLVILAAHTSFGKSTMALKIARYVAETQGDVAFFSLEMSAESLFMKVHSSVSGLNSNKIRPFMSNKELETLLKTLEEMKKVRVFIDSKTTTLGGIRAKARRLKKTNKNLKLIIVDYLQLIGTTNDRQEERDRITQVSRTLKLLAKELECPIIALSQFSRDSYKSGEEPKLSDLYGAGAIEKDADHVWFLHGEKPEESQIVRAIEFILKKQRNNGGLGRIWLGFNVTIGEFSEGHPDIEAQANAISGTVIAYKRVKEDFDTRAQTSADNSSDESFSDEKEEVDLSEKDEDYPF